MDIAARTAIQRAYGLPESYRVSPCDKDPATSLIAPGAVHRDLTD
jgi:hypothetical protein